MSTKNKTKKITRIKRAQFLPFFLVGLIIVFFNSPAWAKLTNADCLACHSDKDLEAETERGKTLNLFVPEDVLSGTAHEGMSCTDCHSGENESVFEEIPHGTPPLKMKCSECHSDTYASYIEKDLHGLAYKRGNPRAPYCNNCHGGHNILPMSSPQSRMSRQHQADTCGKCHGEEKLNLEDNITKRNLITRYKNSVHYDAIKAGKKGATCTDCHSHHNILSSASPNSTVSRTAIPMACSPCHPDEAKAYLSGPHGRSLEHGNNDVPNCIVCHGDHDMASLRSRQGDAKQWASTQVCIWCHNNERMMARYGLDTTPVQSYMSDFHGLTQRGTMGESATCSDCHQAHYSLPSSHPGSRMHISNRGAACGQCHGKVSDSFSQSFTHRKAMEKPGAKVENIIRTIYILLIAVSVSGMLFYNFLIWFHAVRTKFKNQRKQKHVNRMSGYERISHFILLSTFFTLVITGFALKFPAAFWAKWLFALGMTEPVRAFIHRFAASLMTVDLIVFLFYLFMRRRGRGFLYQVLPRKRDFSDFFSSVKYYVGLSKSEEAPRYAVFNFAEKFEFWALLWGTFVMFVSGIILWFPKAIPASWPSWLISTARVLHYYEALLATLAILIWHMFHVMFHPAEYPLNTSWITGYITDKEAHHRFEDKAVEIMQQSGKKD